MNFKYLSKAVAKNQMELWESRNWKISNYSLSNEYDQMRTHFQNVAIQIDAEDLTGFKYDIKFGLALFNYLNGIKSFDLREASRDDFWNYISIQVIPEIIAKRWDVSSHVRFYSQSNRMWLKSLYWFVYLSWQGDEEQTRKLFEFCTTDTVVQLTERTAKGFNVNLSRCIMAEYLIRESSGKTGPDPFRKVMKLNTAYIKTFEPELYDGGLKGYSTWLFDKVYSEEKT